MESQDKPDPAELAESALKPSERAALRARIRAERARAEAAEAEAAHLREEIDALGVMGEPSIDPSWWQEKREGPPSANPGASAVLVASDWHIDEIVEPSAVLGLNRFDPIVAKERARIFFRVGARLIDLLRPALRFDGIALALLGDFITGDIHEENAENASMTPMEGIILAQDLIASGIAHLRDRLGIPIDVICHSGNHARTTKKTRHAKEHGHSLEFLMYVNLARSLSGDGINFRVAKGYQSFLDLHGLRVRFHHGHRVQFWGGVGGLSIPANKAIAQWDKAMRADLDVFGHHHHLLDGRKWFANGSLIGYSALGVSIKSEYEPPMQALLVIDEKRGRTWTAPIYVER